MGFCPNCRRRLKYVGRAGWVETWVCPTCNTKYQLPTEAIGLGTVTKAADPVSESVTPPSPEPIPGQQLPLL